MVALFLEDWELGRVALSCHMAMDLLRLAQSRWAPSFYCVRSVSDAPLQNRHSNRAFHHGRAVTIEEMW